MPSSRLPFVLEDLVLEVHTVCGGGTDIGLALDAPAWDKVVGELRNHSAGDVVLAQPTDGTQAEARFKGVTIIRLDDVRDADN